MDGWMDGAQLFLIKGQSRVAPGDKGGEMGLEWLHMRYACVRPGAGC